jgi:hypothetical protein
VVGKELIVQLCKCRELWNISTGRKDGVLVLVVEYDITKVEITTTKKFTVPKKFGMETKDNF